MTAHFLPTVLEPRNPLSVIAGGSHPAFFAFEPATAKRVLEFFTANTHSPNIQKAYAKSAGEFAAGRSCKRHRRTTLST